MTRLFLRRVNWLANMIPLLSLKIFLGAIVDSEAKLVVMNVAITSGAKPPPLQSCIPHFR